MALEASQSESAALKLAYQYSSEKYAELKSTYEDLLEQLKEEGAFLVKRDRERFRAALKDLKVYYKLACYFIILVLILFSDGQQ